MSDLAAMMPTLIAKKHFTVEMAIECGFAPEDVREVHYEQVQAQINEIIAEPVNVLEYERRFSPEEMGMLQRGVRAMNMEDKWNITFDDANNEVKFERSWTSDVVLFIMPVDVEQMKCERFRANTVPFERNSPQDIVNLFSIVLDHVVFELPMPRPFIYLEPFSMSMWSWIGRRALVTA